MHHRDHQAHTEAQSHAHCKRTDWAMRQHADDMRRLLSINPEHARIARLMTERGVPADVQRRVLAGG